MTLPPHSRTGIVADSVQPSPLSIDDFGGHANCTGGGTLQAQIYHDQVMAAGRQISTLMRSACVADQQSYRTLPKRHKGPLVAKGRGLPETRWPTLPNRFPGPACWGTMMEKTFARRSLEPPGPPPPPRKLYLFRDDYGIAGRAETLSSNAETQAGYAGVQLTPGKQMSARKLAAGPMADVIIPTQETRSVR